jgi:hypothetical protein
VCILTALYFIYKFRFIMSFERGCMGLGLVDRAMVSPLFGAGPVAAAGQVCSLTKTILVAVKNSSGRVFFDERIMKFPGVSAVDYGVGD